MKRTRDQAGFKNRSNKPRKSRAYQNAGVMGRPVTTYNSRVPMATRGYRPNPTELKVFDIAVNTYNVNSTPIFQTLCLPQLGSDMTNRIGRKIVLKTVQIRGTLQIADAAIQPPGQQEVALQRVRMILLWDTQPNGAVPALLDVLTFNDPSAQLNLDSRDRFKVLRDKMFVLGPYINDTASSKYNTEKSAVNVKIFKKLDLETIFSTSTGAVADIKSGNLLCLWLGISAGLNGPAEFVGSYRVRFDDK